MIEVKFTGDTSDVMNEIAEMGRRLRINPDQFEAMEAAGLSPAMEEALDAVENMGPTLAVDNTVEDGEKEDAAPEKKKRRPRGSVPPKEPGIRMTRKAMQIAAKDELDKKLAEAAEMEAAGLNPPEIPAVTVTETGRVLEVADKANPTVGDCRASLNLLASAKGTLVCEELLGRYGAVRVSEVPEDRRAEFLAECEKIRMEAA